MTGLRDIGFGILLSLLLSAPVAAAMANPREIAEATAAEWNKALRKGRIQHILSLYTENAIVLQPGGQCPERPGRSTNSGKG
jgi:hypothetical protein